MQRSTTQVLYRYLPGSVFQHEDGFFAQVDRVNGERVSDVNMTVLLEELGRELDRWRAVGQVSLADPRTNQDQYRVFKPTEVYFDLYPLTFECTRCRRVKRWFKQGDVVTDSAATGAVRCAHQGCGGRMRQLRYLTSHNCGSMQPIHTQRCPNCQAVDHMTLDDFGSFRSSSWRCKACGASIGMRFTPCNCNRYAGRGGQAFQQGRTARDQRLWYPQTITIVNISDTAYNDLQQHPMVGAAVLASWLGDEPHLAASLRQLGVDTGDRMTAEAWAAQEKLLRDGGIDEGTLDELRKIKGPATSGVPAIVAGVSDTAIAAAGERVLLERAGLYDTNITPRTSFASVRAAATGAEATTLDYAASKMAELGIDDVSVTQSFPIVLASYGYTRERRDPGLADLRGYGKANRYEGKDPIFAVPADTEALLVTLDARTVLGFLAYKGLYTQPVPGDLRDAKLAISELFAGDSDVGGDSAAATARRLVHSASHALLRALDDGQTGFGESSLAEWVATDALTTVIYVSSYNDFTLGAFDTVLRRRVLSWLELAVDGTDVCDNDPMCSHVSSKKPHAACDRCLHLSFGCRTWNADLDRTLLRDFWLWAQTTAAP